MKSDKTLLALLAHYAGKAGDYGSAANRYCRLWTTLPARAGTGGTEVSGGSYAAEECSGSFPTPTTGDTSVSNNAAIDFGTATAAWGDIVGCTISTASTGTTTFLVIITFDNVVTVADTDPFSLAIGALVLEEQ